MDLASRDRAGDATVEHRVVDVEGPLAGREVAQRGVAVRVDQAGDRGRPGGIDDDIDGLVRGIADRGDPPILDEDRRRVGERVRDVAGDDRPDPRMSVRIDRGLRMRARTPSATRPRR